MTVQQSSEQQHVLCSIGMIRHSARLDEVFGCTWSDQKLRPYDTPISDYDLPTRSASKLVSYDFQAVISSPFRRCLQTAAVIANRFGLKVLFVDNRLGEIMHQVKSAIKKQLVLESTTLGGVDSMEDVTVATSSRWQYMTLEEAERIAEDSGLLLRWESNVNKPCLEESIQSFISRCNMAPEIITDAHSKYDINKLMEELEELESSIVSLKGELAKARETVARASEQLLATFCNTLGLGPSAASDKMYEIANEAEQTDLGYAEEDRDGGEGMHSQLPVEVAYMDALATVSPLQRSLDNHKRKQDLLRNIVANISEELSISSDHPDELNTCWTSALLVTHADLLNQRLQRLEPNALYAPRCCGWFVEDPRTNVVVGMDDMDRIM